MNGAVDPSDPSDPTGPGLQSSPLIYGSTEDFAEEPEDWSQVHKVLTRDLTRLETQVRALKRKAWPVPLAAAVASAGLSIAATGGIPIGDYHTGKHSALTVPPSRMDWVLFVTGAAVAILAALWWLVSRHQFRSDVDAVVDEVKTLRYEKKDDGAEPQ